MGDGASAGGGDAPRRMVDDDYVPAMAGLERCGSCGRRKARPSDGFCDGCGARPDAVARYESYQVMKAERSER